MPAQSREFRGPLFRAISNAVKRHAPQRRTLEEQVDIAAMLTTAAAATMAAIKTKRRDDELVAQAASAAMRAMAAIIDPEGNPDLAAALAPAESPETNSPRGTNGT